MTSRTPSSTNTSRRATGAAALVGLALVAVATGACSTGDESPASGTELPRIVVTSNVVGDVVENLVEGLATVEVIMPPGADPHDFQPSAQQVASIRSGEVLVTNGAGFEEGLLATIESAEADGIPVCVAIEGVDPLEPGESSHDDGHSEVDPHFFTDPSRTADAARHLTDCVDDAVDGIDRDALETQSAAYIAELEQLDAEVEEQLGAIPTERRVLVTNHEVFGYFADRYGFEVVGTIIPSATTQSQADADSLSELAALMGDRRVPAVFAETSSPDQLAEALAGEVGDVEVVSLFSESLGPDGGETYLEMVRTNAARISDALS